MGGIVDYKHLAPLGRKSAKSLPLLLTKFYTLVEVVQWIS